MSGGKPIPVGPTAKFQGINWAELDKLTPEQINYLILNYKYIKHSIK
jgi:hypothetical protein